MFDLTGMTALVTGASGGIGFEIARALMRQGAKVALSGTSEEKLSAARERMQVLRDGEAVRFSVEGFDGGSIEHPILPCNLSDPAAVDALALDAAQARALRARDALALTGLLDGRPTMRCAIAMPENDAPGESVPDDTDGDGVPNEQEESGPLPG